MKVLQINTVVNSGSTGRITEEIGKTILKNGDESFIAYAFKGTDSKSSEIIIGNKIDFYHHVLRTRLFDDHGKGSERATNIFLKKVEKIKPDIIHLHNIHGYYLHYPIIFEYFSRTNIPVVWTFHDCWPFTGHCSFFDRFDCEKWKKECYSCPMLSYYPKSWGFDNSTNNYKLKKKYFSAKKNLYIITPSNWLKKLVAQSFLKQNQVEVIRNGIDLNVFKPIVSSIKKKMNLQDYKIVLGVASIWDKRKGLEDFIQLCKLLGNQYKIVLVGLNKDQLKDLPENVIGILRTESSTQLAELYSAASVFVNPTYSDNFPTTNIESLACGTPVITYNTGGSPEAIDGKTGIVVHKRDIQGLKLAIETIMETDENFSTEDCRNRAVQNFNKEDRFKDYFNLYQNVLLNG